MIFAFTQFLLVLPLSLIHIFNSDDTLRTEMNSKNKPAIFSCMNAETLVEWTEGGFAMDLSKATNEEFKQLVADIPESFNLTDGTANYGIPYNVEGYGYIVDKEMLAALFGEDQVCLLYTSGRDSTSEKFPADSGRPLYAGACSGANRYEYTL